MPVMSASVLLATLLFANSANKSYPSELANYLAAPDTTYHYSVSQDQGDTSMDLVSQTWQGHPWTHKVLYHEVSAPTTKGLAVLFITGNGPRPGDRALVPMVAKSANLPSAFLFSIPNQPLYGLSEDDLIAYTFDKYLKTKDATWPLLFPMTKSVLRAMDAIEDATKSSANPIHRFIVTGASKRGWTTWLTAASGDKRVVAIAPMVIDNLNVGRQMKHQIELWGKYSEQIEAYTKLGLQAKFGSEEGRHLAEIVDPYSYRSLVKVPTLIITGANDPYWTADACRQYYGDLKQPKWLVTVPNVGHNLGGGAEAIETLGAFCHAISGNFKMPRESWTVKQIDRTHVRVSLRASGSDLQKLTVWVAKRSDFDFKFAKYEPAAVVEGNLHSKGIEAVIEISDSENTSLFGELTYKSGSTFRLCCPTTVFKAPIKN